MATFVQTTLTKRTGATTTVFDPSVEEPSGVRKLLETGTFAHLGREISVSSKHTGSGRRTYVQVAIPQVTVDGNGLPTKRSTLRIKVEMFVPDNALQTEVDDAVGYLESICKTGTANFNDILVNGVGVY